MAFHIEADTLLEAVASTRSTPFAFVALPDGAIGVADANADGYTPVPTHLADFGTYEAANTAADLLNNKRGLNPREVFKIIASTMGGRHYVEPVAGAAA